MASLAPHTDWSKFTTEPVIKPDSSLAKKATARATSSGSTKRANGSDVQRLANLFQISSAFGIAMEAVDQQRMQLACYEQLQKETLNEQELAAIATALSDSYPFSSNMDRDMPGQNLKPLSGKDVLLLALKENWTKAKLAKELDQLRWRKASN